MKVLYLGGFDLPDKNAAAQRVVANAKILRALGYNVTLVGLDKVPGEFEFEGFRCVNLKYPSTLHEWLQHLASIKQYQPFLEETGVGLVIAYNHPAAALEKLLNYNRKWNVKTLSDCTEWYEPQGNWLFRKIKGLDVDKRMYDVHCRLDGIITISRYLDDFYHSKGVKTLLLPPLVDKQDKKWQTKGEVLQDGDIIRLLYAGSPGGTKDRLDIIIEALAAIAGEPCRFRFDVIGIDEQQYRSVYMNGGQGQIPAFVHFHGRLPHKEAVAALKEADFQIFLRDDHLANRAGFPTKFAEAISAGTIVLTNASSNLKDYMVEGKNSFELDISSPERLAETLAKPLSLQREEIQNIKVNLNSNLFDYHNFINLTEQFLHSVYEENS